MNLSQCGLLAHHHIFHSSALSASPWQLYCDVRLCLLSHCIASIPFLAYSALLPLRLRLLLDYRRRQTHLRNPDFGD